MLQLDRDWHPVRNSYKDVANPVVYHLQKVNDVLGMIERQFCKAADYIRSIKQYADFGHDCPFPLHGKKFTNQLFSLLRQDSAEVLGLESSPAKAGFFLL